MAAYYNEFDPFAAAWLRELIKAGLIADGEVDERSINDVRPDDLAGFTQCHLFAGIGVWSYALRRAGWPDDRPVWTGSCPCQPFSNAGKGAGFADERHLWPAFFHLLSVCAPPVVFGEQVASKDGLAWLDLVHADLEGSGYACGAVDTCSAGFGSAHIRQRLYWVADYDSERFHREQVRILEGGSRQARYETSRGGSTGKLSVIRTVHRDGFPIIANSAVGWVANAERADHRSKIEAADHREQKTERSADRACGCGGASCGVEHTGNQRRERGEEAAPRHEHDRTTSIGTEGEYGAGLTNSHRIHRHRPGPLNGFWSDADWLLCRDGQWRPVEPGTFPLAHGSPARVGRLRGYGNAINAEQATAFVESYIEEIESTFSKEVGK